MGEDAPQVVGEDETVGSVGRVAHDTGYGIEESCDVQLCMVRLGVTVVDSRKAGEVCSQSIQKALVDQS